MAGNGKRSLEEIFEEHLKVTKAGFERVNQNIADTAMTLQGQIDALQHEMKTGFEQVDKRFEQVDKRFEQVDKHLVRIDGRFNHALLTSGARALDHEERIAALEADVAKLKAD